MERMFRWTCPQSQVKLQGKESEGWERGSHAQPLQALLGEGG